MSKAGIARRKFNPDLTVDESLANRERLHRRRAIFTDQPLSSQLSRTADASFKTTDKLVTIPDTDKIFKYSCSGLIGGKSDLTGKHIEWKATFDRPLEHLIYPSLQRFEAYEAKSKSPKRPYGLADVRMGSSHTYSPDPITTIGGDKPPSATSAAVHEDAVYLFTPKWTMSLKDVDKPAEDATSSDTSDAIETEGELYLRVQTREKAARISEQRLKDLASSASGARRRREGLPGVASSSMQLSSGQLYESLVRQSTQSRLKKTQEASSNSSSSIPTAGACDAALPDPEVKKPVVDSSNNANSFTSEQEVFNKHRRALAQSVPDSQSHLLDGLLFYRYQNENRKAEIEHDREINEVLMRTQGLRIAHRGSSIDSFSTRFARRKKVQLELSLKREEVERLKQSNRKLEELNESSMASSQSEDKANEKYSIDKLTRLQRAMSGINGGLPKGGAGHRSTSTNKTSFQASGTRLVSRRILSSSVESAADDSTHRRAGFTLTHPTDLNEGGSLAYRKLFSETNVRHAQDLLLLAQIERGVLPEQFIKQSTSSDDPDHVNVVLSKYGIGDMRGLCLGICLQSLTHLDSLGLSDNRLTSVSLPSIIAHLSFKSLMALDLSCNVMHGPGVEALASFFSNKTVLEDVDLSSCGITCADVTVLFSILKVYSNRLEECRLASNLIGEQGVHSICSYLISEHCHLVELDLSWNNAREAGAGYFANVAIPYNKTLKVLNLSSNAIGDTGGQFLMNSLKLNSKLTHLTLSQNEIADYTCFVASKVLKKHPSLLRLDLSFNCLGEAGSRSLFRNILRGMSCWVIMENCTFFDRTNMYNHSFPSNDNPYALDLSEPYKAAVLNELLVKYAEDPTNCSFEGLTYREDVTKGPEQSISLVVNSRREVCLKASGEQWLPPDKGLVRFSFQQAVSVPTIEHAIKDGALDMLMRIVEAGREADRKKDVDRKRQWLQLLSQDTFFTTQQVQMMIDRFHRNNTIGDGELTKADVLKSVWNYVVDTENKFDFLYANTNEAQRRDVIYELTLKRYKFNWANPTANWKLNLEDKLQRIIMFQLVAINNVESDFSKNSSNRGDTSQNGNWFNFRNAKYTMHKETREVVIDRDFVKNIPTTGSIDFDYVSTTRPSATAWIDSQLDPTDNAPPPAGSIRVISEDEFFRFQDMLRLSSRKKISAAGALFVLLDLQLAATKHYFTIDHIHLLLETFEDEWQVQSRVVICMFSRIVDLYRIDILLRSLERKAQHEIMHRLGCLNVINPLKISFDYSLCLKYLDNRIVLISMMELASIESADQIIEESNTELPIQTMYGAYTRTLNESRPETMKFQYADFGKRTKNVSWPARRDLLRKFLVGSHPVDERLYSVINQYKELEAAGRLTEGPIDLQYNSFLKDAKSGASRAKANTKAMIDSMRSNASSNLIRK